MAALAAVGTLAGVVLVALLRRSAAVSGPPPTQDIPRALQRVLEAQAVSEARRAEDLDRQLRAKQSKLQEVLATPDPDARTRAMAAWAVSLVMAVTVLLGGCAVRTPAARSSLFPPLPETELPETELPERTDDALPGPMPIIPGERPAFVNEKGFAVWRGVAVEEDRLARLGAEQAVGAWAQSRLELCAEGRAIDRTVCDMALHAALARAEDAEAREQKIRREEPWKVFAAVIVGALVGLGAGVGAKAVQ